MSIGTVLLVGSFALISGCDSAGSVFELKSPDIPKVIDASNFVHNVDHPLWPLLVGMTWRYESNTIDGLEVTEVEVLSDRRIVQGVSAVVVRDQVFLEGELIEDTFDWYAQDKSGNVWYVGEDSKEYRNGVVVSTAGSWESGVSGGRAGIYMYASPKVGDLYYQEYFEGKAEDVGEVLAINQSVTVPSGSFTECVQIRDTTPLQPDVLEHKYFCPGVGTVLTIDLKANNLRDELVLFATPQP